MNQSILKTLQPVIALFRGNPWMQGGAVILTTFFLASVFSYVFFFVIRQITRRTHFDLDDDIVRLLHPPVYCSLIAAGISAGIGIMPITIRLEQIGNQALKTIVVLFWTLFGIQLASLLLNRLSQLSKKYTFIQRSTVTLFDNLARVAILALGIYFIFVIWDINMTAWLASAGIAGIAIGFAAKDTLANLFSGVFILADAPYKIGDYVVLDNGDRGKVTRIGLRSTRILTRDDVEITIPNSIMGNSTIINQSGGPHEKLRLRVRVGVAYDSDIDQVRTILLEVAREEPLVCNTPEPRVRFRLFGDSGLIFELLCWARKPALRGRTMDRLNDAIYKGFAEANIEIPYQKKDIYIRSLPRENGQKNTPGRKKQNRSGG